MLEEIVSWSLQLMAHPGEQVGDEHEQLINGGVGKSLLLGDLGVIEGHTQCSPEQLVTQRDAQTASQAVLFALLPEVPGASAGTPSLAVPEKRYQLSSTVPEYRVDFDQPVTAIVFQPAFGKCGDKAGERVGIPRCCRPQADEVAAEAKLAQHFVQQALPIATVGILGETYEGGQRCGTPGLGPAAGGGVVFVHKRVALVVAGMKQSEHGKEGA
ncbi:hypothetical protein BK662_15785 [Pseudomonas frederiksbergensis]|uniref:Uncharacterized protein n=1 Tax=Pseudomonas frederiksbergensis TaxID=104087 RepID=A0A423HP45_9PSED|nr:hypothetical protein BK662_15785 [Pseudomonas frederiksbergensis]